MEKSIVAGRSLSVVATSLICAIAETLRTHMTTRRRYFGVVHVRWELPFVLRLPPEAFLCWDPVEGIATFVGLPRLGTIQWRRAFPHLKSEDLFGDRYVAEPSNALPTHEYLTTAVISGREFPSTLLHPGAEGGFDEAQTYTVANVYMCLRTRSDFDSKVLLSRAAQVLNNLLGLHALLGVDGQTRLLRSELDSYYTLFSIARIPDDWPQLTAEEILHRLKELSFQSDVGAGRHHNIGIGSPDDFAVQVFDSTVLDIFATQATGRIDIETHQQLLLSAVRRLRRQEIVLAIIDAESAVEVLISSLLVLCLRDHGLTDSEVDVQLDGPLSSLQQRIVRLDKFSKARTGRDSFENSTEERRWRMELAKLRHDVVHRGRRDVTFEQARKAISAGFDAVLFLERMFPDLAPRIKWDAVSLEWVSPNARKLFRLFDT